MRFEGQEVDVYEVVIRQFRGPIGTPLTLGEVVELTVMVQVTEVSHREHGKNGQIYRDHIVKVLEVT